MVKITSKYKPQQSLHTTSKQFKGVRMRKGGKWVSEVRMPNSTARIWLGSYDSPQQAARAHDCAVFCLRGRNAKFNFPHSLPQIPSTFSLSPAQIQAAAAEFAREDFWQPLRNDPQSQSRQILEEHNCALLDSLLDEVEKNQSLNLEDFHGEDVEGVNFVQRGRLIQDAEAMFDKEEVQQPLREDAALSCWESLSSSSKDSHQILEEQNCALLDSLLEDVEKNQSLNVEKFPEEDLEGVDFVLLLEEQGALFLQQTQR